MASGGWMGESGHPVGNGGWMKEAKHPMGRWKMDGGGWTSCEKMENECGGLDILWEDGG